jgi:hypothetical protein
LRLATALTSEWHFFLGLPKWSPETIPIWTLGTLGVHNFSLQPLIGMRSKANLYFSLKAFQWCVALHLHTLESGRFLTFSGCSLTPGLSFAYNLCFICPNGSCKAILDIYTPRPFQGYKEHLNARCFDPCNRVLSFQESRRTPKSHFRECEWRPHTSFKVGLWQNMCPQLLCVKRYTHCILWNSNIKYFITCIWELSIKSCATHALLHVPNFEIRIDG